MTSTKLFCLKNFLTICAIAILAGLMAFSISLWQTPKYKSTVKLLAVFNQSNIDTYTASQTANYITGILSEVIYSDSFIDSVYKNEPALIDNLGQGSERRQKNWKKIVKTQILDNKGIMIIDTFSDNKYQANILASAVGSVIVSQHGAYDGSSDRVTIKMIDIPSVYENWATTKVVSDAGLGLLAGLLLGFAFIVIFPNHKLFEIKKRSKPADQLADRSNEFKTTAPGRATVLENSTAKADYAPGKITNPWLDQYYQENLPDKLINQDNL